MARVPGLIKFSKKKEPGTPTLAFMKSRPSKTYRDAHRHWIVKIFFTLTRKNTKKGNLSIND